MSRLLCIDPGMSTGIIYAGYDDTTPFKILGRWELKDGGLPQFAEWVESGAIDSWRNMTIVCEKFSPLPRVFKLRELEPLRMEGYIYGLVRPEIGMKLVWQRPQMMNIAGDNHGSAAKNFQAANNALRKMGLWTTGKKDFGVSDSDDVNSASKHLVAYFRSIGHGPSLEVINGML